MEEKIYYTNSRGNKLCGLLSNPTSQHDRPIIILSHGFDSSKESGTIKKLQERFNEQGISTFRFDFLGHGESDGNLEDLTISESIDDIERAINYLKQQGYTKIGLFGTSFAGTACLIVSSKNPDLIVLLLKSPVSNAAEIVQARKNFEEWQQRGYKIYKSKNGIEVKLTFDLYKDYLKHDGYEAAKKIKIPTLIVHGNKDQAIPIDQSTKTANLINNCKLEIIQGADHVYSNPEDSEKALNLLTKFVLQNFSK